MRNVDSEEMKRVIGSDADHPLRMTISGLPGIEGVASPAGCDRFS